MDQHQINTKLDSMARREAVTAEMRSRTGTTIAHARVLTGLYGGVNHYDGDVGDLPVAEEVQL